MKSLSFWRDRFVEGGLVLSMALYYVIGNSNFQTVLPGLARLDPRLSLPFLLTFALLCWYRLPFAVALMPLALPYYLFPKTVMGSDKFSMADIILGVCVAVALAQLLVYRRRWPYGFSLADLRDRLGPFTGSILVFLAACITSIFIAYSRTFALHAFREEVFEPLLYLVLAFACLRTRQDVRRLLAALVGMALVIAVLGMVQYFLFKYTLKPESDGIVRVHVVYGSGNSVGLLFDYTLPIVVALLMARVGWIKRLLAFVLCVPLLLVLYLSQSDGARIAVGVAILIIVALSLRSRKLLLAGGVVASLALVVALAFYHTQIDNLLGGHTNQQGYNTISKRLYLWESALNMIHDSPWFGYGLDNWLCHYSDYGHYSDYRANTGNTVCKNDLHHYWITVDPVTHKSTGLKQEPNLSHPHNVFLHVWVSIGLSGLLAFIAVLGMFFWTAVRMLMYLRAHKIGEGEQVRWMVIGVGTAMLAALAQGQGDSSFLEQDLAYCFWMLVLALLLLRSLYGIPWTGVLPNNLFSRRDKASV